MKRFYTLILLALVSLCTFAQGWPAHYDGVMLQGFYWDSYDVSTWSKLTNEADELSKYFSLIWVPQSGNCNTTSNVMGYMPVYYFDQNSSFGTETQLRSMIQTFKAKNTGIIADVVINHRNNLGVGGSWVDYPAETYGGKTYQMTATDICANDDGGQTAAWATKQGLSLSPNADTGDDWSGCRDIDHKSENVRATYKDYLRFLLSVPRGQHHPRCRATRHGAARAVEADEAAGKCARREALRARQPPPHVCGSALESKSPRWLNSRCSSQRPSPQTPAKSPPQH